MNYGKPEICQIISWHELPQDEKDWYDWQEAQQAEFFQFQESYYCLADFTPDPTCILVMATSAWDGIFILAMEDGAATVQHRHW